MNIGMVTDIPTGCCLHGHQLPPWFGATILRIRKCRLLFVESAWSGWKNLWKYRIAAYPDHPERNSRHLLSLVQKARKLGIPTVFWNKEDSCHFERFIDSARHFDHVFTIDANCVPRYKAVMGMQASVHVLPFAVNPQIHAFTGFHFRHQRANFTGSYSSHIHPQRRERQMALFAAASESGLGLTIIDRNSGRKNSVYRYPMLPHQEILRAVSYPDTAHIYKDYLVSLNVNTIEDSPTMYSRRLVEIMACGGIAVTTPALSVERLFSDYCHVVSSKEDALELFSRLRHGPSPQDLERARAGAEYVACNHTWNHRLKFIAEVVGL
ncbi:glycosyltransferase [uncultured Desulfovibrio sp.]|uniref:CgeB family protein n=1 Tax=uncultured Desulfovibrio sp. TaxID=167968 RepID=UPI00258545C4|nr:glycosyltransferase [uncultured Desulfovibrio sp.]